eukprot:7678205-Alexandrium_andersonii.AAC.1
MNHPPWGDVAMASKRTKSLICAICHLHAVTKCTAWACGTSCAASRTARRGCPGGRPPNSP